MNSLLVTNLIWLITTLVFVFLFARARNRLKEKEIRLKTVIESQPECVKLQAEDGTIVEMNKAGLGILDVDSPLEVVGHTVYEFISEEYWAGYRELTRNVFRGQNQTMEFLIRGKKGTSRWLETNAVPLLDNKNKVFALLALTRDITERKLLENKLQKRQLELEHVCRVATMGEVASGIAHELNQPICAISSYSETATTFLRKMQYQKVNETLERIVEQAQRASKIVAWIRELAANKSLDLRELDLREVIDEMILMCRPYLNERGVKVQINVDKDIPEIKGDRIQIEQVLINLIRNASDAMQNLESDKYVVIGIAHNVVTNQVKVSVTDRGEGIPADRFHKIMDPYYSTKENGIGMGLAISRSIIKAHGGELKVESSNKDGTTVVFTLQQGVHNISIPNYAKAS